MVVRFEFMWVSIPLLLIPMLFVALQMLIIRVWMFSCPTRERERPSYSMHVMKEVPRNKQPKEVLVPQQPVIPARRQAYKSTYQVARAPHVYDSNRGTPMSSGWGTPMSRMTPNQQFHQFQASGRMTPMYGRP